jgi:hypothetical protein
LALALYFAVIYATQHRLNFEILLASLEHQTSLHVLSGCAPLKNEEMRGRRRIRNGKKGAMKPSSDYKSFLLIVADRHHPSGFRHDQY